MRDKVEEALNLVRPYLRADGGDVELVAVEGEVVKLRLQGACGGCPMATMTMRNAIERLIKERLPEIKQVVAV